MIDVIIVNWNSGNQLRDCLNSIRNFGIEHVSSVIVVDNASVDGSMDKIGLSELPLKLVFNKTNRGFSAACNQGAALSSSEYLLFLNPDTRLFENSLAVPLKFMEKKESENIGICGIQLVDESEQVARTCARFPTLHMFFAQTLGLTKIYRFKSWNFSMTEWDHLSSREVDQVIGAFFIVRRIIFLKLNGFDESFFVYFEELDFSLRARLAGWKSFYLAEAQAFHAGGGTSRQIKAHRLFYSLRSRLLYGFKHFSRLKLALLFVVSMFVEPISRVAFCFVKRDFLGISNTFRAYGMLIRDIPSILSKGRLLSSKLKSGTI